MEQTVPWTFPLIGISAERRGSRPATSKQMASGLIGADGNHESGVRPSPGFKSVTTLDYGYYDDAGLALDGGLNAGGTINGAEWITFRVDDSNYATGAIYRVVNHAGDKAAYRLKVRIGTDSTWETCYSLGNHSGLITPEAYAGEQFHVEVFGRFVYVFREGLRPFMFYITKSGASYTLNVVENTGPGNAPSLVNPTLNSAACKYAAGGGLTTNQDITDVLTTLAVPSDVDGYARIVYFGFSALERVASATYPAGHNNPHLRVRNDVGQTANSISGPSQIGLWATPPQPDPTFTEVAYYVNGLPLTYLFPAYGGYHNDRVGWGFVPGANQPNTPRAVDDSSNIFAYRLYDSRTGRVGPLSNRLTSSQDGFAYSAVTETQVSDAYGLQSVITPVVFPMFQIIYNKSKYDSVRIYRGVSTNQIVTADDILYLEADIKLSDYHIDSQPGDPDWGNAAYFFVSSNEVLVTQDSYNGDDNYLSQMPYAGTAIAYEGIFLFGAMGAIDDSIGGLGKAMWSELTEVSPELVPASNRYPLMLPDEEVIRFARLGPNVAGFSRTMPYLFRREIDYLKAQPMHMGFGLPGPRCICEVGSDVYFLTDNGLHKLTASGDLTDISVINNIIQSDWASDLDKVEMAYDTPTSAIFILNPVQERLAVLWLRTGRLTEMYDCPFTHCRTGDISFNLTTGRKQRRAVFFQAIQNGATSYSWKVFCYDYSRSKERPTLLDVEGRVIVQIAVPYWGTGGVINTIDLLGSNMEGATCYVLTGPSAGQSFKVKYKSGVRQLTIVDNPDLTLDFQDTISISPVFVEWAGASLGLQDMNGVSYSQYNFHKTRHVDSITAAFTTVVWSEASYANASLARYMGGAYIGDSEVASDVRYPSNNDTSDVRSIQEGVSPNAVALSNPNDPNDSVRTGIQGSAVFPLVRTFISGLDYTMLEVQVKGSLRDEDALRRRS